MTAAEEWRPVVGFPDYMVSNKGQVLSLKRPDRPLILKGAVHHQNGYRFVCLRNGGVNATPRMIHRLVAEAFIGPRPPQAQIRHLDGDRFNNAAANLAYGTSSENNLDQVRHGVHANASKQACPRGHAYDDLNTLRRYGRRFCLACQRAANSAYRPRSRKKVSA